MSTRYSATRIEWLVLTSVFFAWGVLPLRADEVDEHAYTTVVSAIRGEESEFDAPRSVERIAANSMDERHAGSVPEMLRDTPGVWFQETNRGAGSPIIRGLIGPQNLVVLDGVRLTTAAERTGPNQYLAAFEMGSVESVEVVRGPSSVLYGNGAMGGVIYINPLRAPKLPPWRMRETTWIRSADMGRGLTVALQDRLDHRTSLVLGGGLGVFDQLRAGQGFVVPNSDYSRGGWSLRIEHDVGRTFDLTTAYYGSVVRSAGRIDQLGRGDLRFYDNDDHLAYLRLRWYGLGVFSQASATISVHRVVEAVRRFDCLMDVDGHLANQEGCSELDEVALTRKQTSLDEVNVLGIAFDAQWNLLSNRLRLYVGAEGYLDMVDSSLRSALATDGFVERAQDRGTFSDDSQYLTSGAHLFGKYRVVDFGRIYGEINATAGMRLSYFAATAQGVPGVDNVDYGHLGVVGSGGLQWLLSNRFNLYTSIDSGFRAPNLHETTVLGDTGSFFEVPNPDLDPERSLTFELGMKGAFSGVFGSVAAYYSLVSDLISRRQALYNGASVVDGKSVVQRVNEQKGEYRGVEGRLGAQYAGFIFETTLAYVKATVWTDPGRTQPGRRIPPLSGSASLRYGTHEDRGYIEFYVDAAAPQSELNEGDKLDLRVCETGWLTGQLDDTCSGSAAWSTLNMRAGWRFGEFLELVISVLNLGDVRYRMHGSGVEQPGFNAHLSLTTRI